MMNVNASHEAVAIFRFFDPSITFRSPASQIEPIFAMCVVDTWNAEQIEAMYPEVEEPMDEDELQPWEREILYGGK